MKKNKKAPARHKAEDDYLLTTKLFCGSCKAMMVGESGTSSSKGQVYHYYRCVNSKRKKTCEAKHRSVRKDPLERTVVASVMRNIMDDAFVEYFTDQALALQGQESNELPALRRQLADTEKAIDNMLNAIQAGIFNASTKRRLDELEATKEKLELSIIKEEMKKPQFTREQIQFYILQFRKVDTNTLEGRRRLIDGFVNSVVVYDDYILVTFNYKEGAERITFEQIERSDLSSFGGPKNSESFGFRNFFYALLKMGRAGAFRRGPFFPSPADEHQPCHAQAHPHHLGQGEDLLVQQHAHHHQDAGQGDVGHQGGHTDLPPRPVDEDVPQFQAHHRQAHDDGGPVWSWPSPGPGTSRPRR